MIPTAVVFIYKATIHNVIPTDRLQRALARVLDYYPHLTGRLLLDKSTGSRYITKLGEGAELLLAETTTTLKDHRTGDTRLILDRLPGQGNDLLPPFDPSEEAVCSSPLLTIQHTRFADGSVALGVRGLHTVCDASGLFQFMQDLAGIYRGLSAGEESTAARRCPPHITSYPVSNPSATTVTSAPACSSAQFYLKSSTDQPENEADELAITSIQDPETVEDKHSLKKPPLETSAPAPTITGRTLRFTSAEIHAIKAEATSVSTNTWISTFEALSAHICQSIYRARVKHRISSGQLPSAIPSSDFLTPIDWRAPNRLNFPARYFPNALLCAVKTFSPEMLVDGTLADVAEAMHETIRNFSPQQASQIVDWMSCQPDKQLIEQRFDGSEGSCMISAWQKIDMYGVTFDVDAEGIGVKPIFVAQPFTEITLWDGLCYLLPTEKQGEQCDSAGDIDVCLALQDCLWDVLENDVGFRRFRKS